MRSTFSLALATAEKHQVLLGQIASVRQSLTECRELLQREPFAPPPAAAAPAKATECGDQAGTFPAVRELIAQINRMPQRLEPLDAVVEQIHNLSFDSSDPVAVAAALLDAIIQFLGQHMPKAECQGTMSALFLIASQRLSALDAGLG